MPPGKRPPISVVVFHDGRKANQLFLPENGHDQHDIREVGHPAVGIV